MSAERKPSRGAAKHIRRELARVRVTPPALVEQRAPVSDTQLLQDIKQRLNDSHSVLKSTVRAELTIQSHWLEFKLRIIDNSERMSRIQKYLDELSKLEPETRKWLSEPVTPWLTRLGSIRESVIPAAEGELLRRGHPNP